MQNPYEDSNPRIKSQEATSTFQAGYQQTADPNLVAHQLDPNPVLEPLWHSLKEDVYNEVNGKWMPGSDYGITPAINIKGINFIINKIRLRFNHFTSLSWLDEEQIDLMCEECENITNEALFEKEAEFEVDEGMKSSIISDVGHAVLIGLNRAKNQSEKVFLAKTLESKQVFQTQEPVRKGIKKIFPW